MRRVAGNGWGWPVRGQGALFALVLGAAMGCGDDGGSQELACAALECGANGSCVEADAGASCACDEGYAGATCEQCAEGYELTSSGCQPSMPGPSCEEASC